MSDNYIIVYILKISIQIFILLEAKFSVHKDQVHVY